MLKKALPVTVTFLLSVFYSLSQIPAQIIFNKITKKEGLASNTTFGTVQDNQGFIWVATQNGLQRYDGNRFITFRNVPGNAFSVPENSVNRMFIDSKGRLWLLFNKHVGLFNTTNFKFSETAIDTNIAQIKKIVEDAAGHITLFADNKQYVYDEEKHSFDALYSLPAIPAGYTIWDMAIDHMTGSYWFTGRQGSLIYDPSVKQFHYKEQNTGNFPELDSIGSIKNARYPFIAKDGTWWFVSWIPFTSAPPVLINYDKKKNKLQRFEKIRAYKADSYYEIWNIFQQSNGTIWVYGMGLLAYYNTEENCFIHINSDPSYQPGIDYDFVSNLFEDREKNVWVSTNNGWYRFNLGAQVFRNIPNRRPGDTTAAPNAVSVVLQTKNNDVWVSTWGAGIFSYNKQLHPIANPIIEADPANKSLHGSYMVQRRNGEIWIGTQSGELKIYDPAVNKLSTLSHTSLKSEVITQLLEDHKGNMWIGSSSGHLVKCNNSNWKDTLNSFKTILKDASDIMKIYEDSNHHLWICTATNGIYELDSGDGHVLKQIKKNAGRNDGLLNDGATDILQYNDSIFLIASDGLCILNNRTNTFTYHTSADGLPAEHISTLIVDQQKRLWVALDGGLYRLNIDNKLHVSYGASDGIINDVFQVSSGTVLQDGRVAFGTQHDFLVFDPAATIDTMSAPVVTITGFVLGTTTLPVDSLQRLNKVALSYDNTFINIELSTLSFRDQYYKYYMLEGLDKTWKRVSNNEITYQYLPPGDYTLMLKSVNGEGAESKITNLRISVTPPFWKRWWFYSIMVLLAGGLLFWFDHERIKRKTAVLKMRSAIADDLHQDINAALSNITILSEMARMKADKEPEKSKEFIEQIHTKSQNITMAMDDILWGIDPTNDSMKSFMLRYREYLDAVQVQYKVHIDILIDNRAENLQLKMTTRNDIFWLFKSGITNVVRMGGTNCRIHITYEKPQLIYTLEYDTGAMDVEQMHNLRHRNELSNRLEELDATLDFKEHLSSAVFVLSIPVKRNGL